MFVVFVLYELGLRNETFDRLIRTRKERLSTLNGSANLNAETETFSGRLDETHMRSEGKLVQR